MRKLRVGICGAGSRGVGCFGQLIAAREDTEVVAVCDPNPVRAAEARRTLGGRPAAFPSLDAMLAGARPDAVIVTTPDDLHADLAVTALRAGAHVLVDKPLATTVKGCQRIIAAAREADRVAMVGFNMRHVNVLRRVKELVDEGRLGCVYFIENREFYDGGRTYFARWNRDSKRSGGLWLHKGSHDFDVFNWLLGFPKPARVSAFAGMNVFTPEHLPFAVRAGVPVGPRCAVCAYAKECPDVCTYSGEAWGEEAIKADGYAKDLCMYMADKDVHDNGVAIVEYENGARASHMECFATSQTDRLYTLIGDRGQAEVSLEQRTIRIRPRWRGEMVEHTIPVETGSHGGSDPNLVQAFVAATGGRRTVESTLEHGLWSTAIGEAAERSRRERRTVEVSELFR